MILAVGQVAFGRPGEVCFQSRRVCQFPFAGQASGIWNTPYIQGGVLQLPLNYLLLDRYIFILEGN